MIPRRKKGKESETIKISSKGLKLRTYIYRPLYANAFELIIYNKREEMEKGIESWLSAQGQRDKIEDVAGTVYENDNLPSFVNKEDGLTYKCFATMFLNVEDLSVEIIAHECGHVVFILHREIYRYLGHYLGNDDSGDSIEENYCYTLGEYIDEVMKICIKNKLNVKLTTKELKKT